MLHAVVQDVAASWVEYERVAGAGFDPTYGGLILHVAGPTDEGVRTIGVWESEEAWAGFRAGRMAPAIAALCGVLGPQPTVREFHPLQVVVGQRPDVWVSQPPAPAAQESGVQP